MADVSVFEEPRLGMVSVRVAPGKDLGIPLPSYGAVASAGEHSAIWLGPDEWLVVTTADPVALTAQLSDALGEDRGLIADVSANRTTIRVEGPGARDLLEHGVPADLHPRAFRPGNAITTTIATVPIVLWQVDDDAYRLLPRTSFADYVTRWLADAQQAPA